MTLLRSIVTAAAGTGTPTFTQDFTDSTEFGGATPKAAIILGSRATAENTETSGMSGVIGFVAGSNQAGIGVFDNNSTNPNSAAYAVYNTQCYSMPNSAGNTDGDASGALIANGLRLSWTDQSIGEIIKVILLGGDIEANVVSHTSNNGTSAQSVSHGLAGTPDFIVALHAFGTLNNDANGYANPGLGFWTASAQNCISTILNSHGVATVNSRARVDTTHAIARKADGAGFVWTGLVGNAGASSFDITYSAAHTETVFFLCVRSTSGTPLAVKTGIFTTPTSTGNSAVVSGMSAAPVVLLNALSRMNGVDTDISTSVGSAFGVGTAVKNSSGTSQYGTIALWDEDGLATSADHSASACSNTQAVRVLDSGSVPDIEATVNSWDSGGITLNFSNINATARHIPYLAFGEVASSPTITDVDTNERVYHGQTGVTITGTNFGASYTGSADVIISPTDNIADGSAVTQTQTSWSATSVQFTADLDSFSFFTNLYVFVKNSTGAANASGFVIQREARFRINDDIVSGGAAWASQSSIQYSIRVSGFRGTELIGGTDGTTNGSGVFTTSYYTLTGGGALAPGDHVYLTLFKDDATLANTRAVALKYLPTYE